MLIYHGDYDYDNEGLTPLTIKYNNVTSNVTRNTPTFFAPPSARCNSFKCAPLIRPCSLPLKRYNVTVQSVWLVWFIVLNSTFNNISIISWRSVLLVEETRVTRENHRPVVSHWQTLSYNVVSSTSRHDRVSNSQL